MESVTNGYWSNHNYTTSLLDEIASLLDYIERENGNAIERENLPPVLVSWIKLLTGTCPNIIEKEQLERYLEILKNEFSHQNKISEESLPVLPSMEVRNKPEISPSNSVEGLEISGNYLKSIEKVDLKRITETLKREYNLSRPYLVKGLLAIYLLQKEYGLDYIPLSKILEFLEQNKVGSIDNIKWKLFGNGTLAKKLQIELFNDSPKFINGERSFRLKDSVFRFIESLMINPKEAALKAEEYLIHDIMSFLKMYEDKREHKPCYEIIRSAIIDGQENWVAIISWVDLYNYNPQLAQKIITTPDIVLDAFRNAIMEIQIQIIRNLTKTEPSEMHFYNSLPLEVQITDYPQQIRPRDIKQKDIGKLVAIRGIIAGSTKIKPFLQVAAYRCNDCGEEIRKMQEPFKMMGTINKCPVCGSKSLTLNITESEKVDIQHFTVQDSPEDLTEGEQFKRVRGYVIGSQAGNIEGGEKVIIYAIVRVLEKFSSGMPAETDYVLEAIRVEPLEKAGILSLTPNDIQEVRKLKETYGDYLPEAVASSIAPWVIGNNDIKKALALSVVGADGLWKKRTSIHVLLIGDPSTAKTDMALDLKRIAPKVVLAEGSSSTGIGLTASVQKDEVTGEYMVYGGALVTGSGGIVIIDEFPSLKREHIDHLRMAMEQGIIPINKANITNMVLKANATIIATGNPKRGHINRNKHILEQLDIPSPILTRFDLIFTLLDYAEDSRDRDIIRSMLNQAKTRSMSTREILEDTLRKYFVYAKTRIFPEFTEEADRKIEQEFIRVRKYTSKGNKAPISRRFGDTLIRLSYAHAKVRLSEKVKAIDVNAALDIMRNMLETVAVDPETGEFDSRILEAGIPSSTIDKMDVILFVIKKYQCKSEFGAPLGDVIKELKEVWNISEKSTKDLINRLKNEGIISGQYTGYLKVEV